jgi:hypothetical protein
MTREDWGMILALIQAVILITICILGIRGWKPRRGSRPWWIPPDIKIKMKRRKNRIRK